MTKDQRKAYRELEKVLGYRFKHVERLEAALTHRSFRFETDGVDTDNERMEFLGDAVLGLLTADHLHRLFKVSREGKLTAMRSRLTSGKALSDLAATIELGRWLRLGKGEENSGARERPSALEDALEAVMGAVFIDGGLRAAKKVFIRLFVPVLRGLESDEWADNPKGRLQALSQERWKRTPHYEVLEARGPAHDREFDVRVSVGDAFQGHGSGRSKQEAQTAAANDALATLTP